MGDAGISVAGVGFWKGYEVSGMSGGRVAETSSVCGGPVGQNNLNCEIVPRRITRNVFCTSVSPYATIHSFLEQRRQKKVLFLLLLHLPFYITTASF